MNLLENQSLKQYNSFGIDAKTRYLLEVNHEEELRELFTTNGLLQQPHLILGGGSNILFTKDFPGTVIRIMTKGRRVVDQQDGHVIIEAQAGEDWDGLVQWAVDNDWGGLENLSLIPGQVGTSPIQNIGAYGVELRNVFHSLVAMEKSTGTLHTFSNDECQFGYRYSIFKNQAKDRFIITSVQMKLTHKNHQMITGYGAIEQELHSMGAGQPTIAHMRQAVCNIRNSKLPDPKVLGNAGSFFKNPVISNEEFTRLKSMYPTLLAFPVDQGMKLAAGWLIEKAGWKGFRKGDAGIHSHQALVLVNHGMASGQDLLDLSHDIQESVNQLFRIWLEPEVNII